MAIKATSSTKISALPMSAQTAIQSVEVSDMTPALDYYSHWWDEITDTKEECEKDALKKIQAMADLNYGELLIDLEGQEPSIQKEFLKKKNTSESAAIQLKRGYLSWKEAKGFLEGEALEKFRLVGYSTKALIQRLPAARQAQAFIDLAEGTHTNTSLRALTQSPEVKLEKLGVDLSAAENHTEKTAAAWDAVKDDPSISSESPAYKEAKDANRHAQESVKTLQTKIKKLEAERDAQADDAAKAKAAASRAKKSADEAVTQLSKTAEKMGDLQRRIREGDYDAEGAQAFYLGSNAIFLTIGGLDHIMGEVRTYLHNAEWYDSETRKKIDQNLFILRDELNDFYKQD